MLPWRNSWFQIAFFAWVVSGALLIVDYAPKISAHSGWMQAFERAPRQQPSEAPAKPSPPTEQEPPVKQPIPARPAPGPASEQPATKMPNASTPAAPKKNAPSTGSSPQANINVISDLLTSHPLPPWQAVLDNHDGSAPSAGSVFYKYGSVSLVNCQFNFTMSYDALPDGVPEHPSLSKIDPANVTIRTYANFMNDIYKKTGKSWTLQTIPEIYYVNILDPGNGNEMLFVGDRARAQRLAKALIDIIVPCRAGENLSAIPAL